MNNLNTVILILTVVISCAAVEHHMRIENNNRAFVYAVCENAHNGQACGNAQTKTDTEFLCTENTINNSQCWVEAK